MTTMLTLIMKMVMMVTRQWQQWQWQWQSCHHNRWWQTVHTRGQTERDWRQAPTPPPGSLAQQAGGFYAESFLQSNTEIVMNKTWLKSPHTWHTEKMQTHLAQYKNLLQVWNRFAPFYYNNLPYIINVLSVLFLYKTPKFALCLGQSRHSIPLQMQWPTLCFGQMCSIPRF